MADAEHNDEAPKAKSKLPLIIGGVVLLLGLGGGGYYFLVAKPAAAKAAEEAAAADEADAGTSAKGGEKAVQLDAEGHPVKKKKKKKKKKSGEKEEPPAYWNLDPFTVNLSDTEQEHYLQATVVLQVPGETAVEEMKKHTAMVRDRVLKILSGSKSADLRSIEGKMKLADQIIEQIATAAEEDDIELPEVSRVFFTAFIIQ